MMKIMKVRRWLMQLSRLLVVAAASAQLHLHEGQGLSVLGYDVYLPEAGTVTVSYLGEGLDYELRVYAVDDWGNRSAAYATAVCTTLPSNNTLCGMVLYNTTNWHTNYGNYDSRVIASASIVGDHRICVQLFPYPGTSPVTGMYLETHTDDTNPSGGRTWIDYRYDWAENYPDLATYMANYNYSNNRTATVKTVTANVGGVPTQGIAVEFDYVGDLETIYFRW